MIEVPGKIEPGPVYLKARFFITFGANNDTFK